MIKHVLAVLAFLTFGVPAYSQRTSQYTSLDESKCKTLELNEKEGGWYRGVCRGVAGYQLEVLEGDLRQTLNVIAPTKQKYWLDLQNITYSFSSLGPRAEWRMNGKVPTAIIFRFNPDKIPEDPSKPTSYLIVAKITKKEICITDTVGPGQYQNTEARRFADTAATKPCKFQKPSNYFQR
jgi:hypothetical protein